MMTSSLKILFCFVVTFAVTLSLPLKRSNDVRTPTDNDTAPPYILDIFNSFTNDTKLTPVQHQYNTIRSFENTLNEGCNDSKYRFIFDLSPIKSQEDVSKTELRVYVEVFDKSPKEYVFKLFYLNNTEIKDMKQTLKIEKSRWITFLVAPAVYNWVKVSSPEPRGFIIKVDNTDNKKLTCQNGQIKIINLRDNPATQPLLVVYTYDYEPRIFQTLENALKHHKNDTRRRRATIGDLKEKHCSLVNFTVTRNEINSVLGQQGVLMLVPDSLKINLCGGACEAGKRIRSLHSTLLNLLLSQKDTSVPNPHNHTKCCVPIKYESINYVLMDKNKSPPFYETSVLPFVVAKQCGCVYSYTKEYTGS